MKLLQINIDNVEGYRKSRGHHRLRTPPTDKLTTILQQICHIAKEPTSRHVKMLGCGCYEIQYTWTARSTETETETGLDRYVMLGARWLTEY